MQSVGRNRGTHTRARGLGSERRTLAEVLKETGYTTAAVVGGPWLKRIFGLNKGFDYYNDSQISTVNGRLANQVTASALNWLKRAREKEVFLFLNYFDPHIGFQRHKLNPYVDLQFEIILSFHLHQEFV